MHERPLRVAIVGSGPAGFYFAEQLLKQPEMPIEVDMFERLPAPYGLVRYGVAPDHEKIRNVIRVYEKIANDRRFRFFGNVAYGRHLDLDALRRHYHAICFATGAQSDRRMGIPGEDLQGSYAATEFVAWYNGHPDFRDRAFDLSVERVAVVGVGNVAVDVARILCRTPEELATTDIADAALAALRRSRVREVYMLGRRGPAQAAFTSPEIRELGELPGADLILRPEEVELDPVSRAWIEKHGDRLSQEKVRILQELGRRPPAGKPRRLVLRFLVSPLEIYGDDRDRVRAMRLARNRLVEVEGGRIVAQPTGEYEELQVGMVLRSVGYRGVPLPGVPFDERRAVVPNERGRVLDPTSGQPVPGLYVTGWIKRGPTGVIGTNKPDAAETAGALLADARAGRLPSPPEPDAAAVERCVRERQRRPVTFQDWKRLDALERARGRSQGRPRAKLTSWTEFLEALEGEPA